MGDKRGFHFLVGIATLWFGWRLYQSGVFHDLGFLATGQPVMTGPGAIMVAFVIEGLIAIGAVAVLVTTGLWEIIMVTGRMIGDMGKTGHAFLYAAAKDRITKQKAAPKPAESPADQQAVAEPKTAGEALMLTIADTRKQSNDNATAIQSVLEKLDAIANRLPAVVVEEPKVEA